MEAVTAAGEVVRCDEDENSDLFWAARGAGPGFFAIVTGFRLACTRARRRSSRPRTPFRWRTSYR